ncbi:MAG: glycoside hydrolase family 15 protein, partial [Methylosarcina sp.]
MNSTSNDKLETYFGQVQDIILSRQDWVTGLLPASTAVTVHGNYTDAWVRDNVYSILAAWGLSL